MHQITAPPQCRHPLPARSCGGIEGAWGPRLELLALVIQKGALALRPPPRPREGRPGLGSHPLREQVLLVLLGVRGEDQEGQRGIGGGGDRPVIFRPPTSAAWRKRKKKRKEKPRGKTIERKME